MPSVFSHALAAVAIGTTAVPGRSRAVLWTLGALCAVVPDADAMLAGHARGEIPFEQLRGVTFGAQEYDGDFHFTMFTPDSLAALLQRAGFANPTVVDRGRPNGDCLEFEITATRVNGSPQLPPQ